MNDNFFSGLYISLTVIAGLGLLALLYYLINEFKEKFDRNFFYTWTSLGLFIGEVLLLWGIVQWGISDVGFAELLTFGVGHNYTPQGSNITQWIEDPQTSWLFYWGLIILLITWIINIRKSSFWWGMFQNIIQGAVVLTLSIIIAIGALLWAEETKKRK